MILNLLDRMKLPFRRNKEFLSALYDILGFYPHDIEIYRIAFSHKSQPFQRESKAGRDRRNHDRRKGTRPAATQRPINNERLEYLGDAILEAVTSDILFRHFKSEREGFLTATRSKLVQRETLNRLAAEMGIDKLIHVAQTTRMNHTNIAGNAFEALVGAIYLDRGYRHCHWFISNRVIGRYLDLDTVAQREVNFKSKLLEWSQKNRLLLEYHDAEANDKTKQFSCRIIAEGVLVGEGRGRSKKEAHQRGSKEALIRLNASTRLYDQVFAGKEQRTAMEAVENFALPRLADLGLSPSASAAPPATSMPGVTKSAPSDRMHSHSDDAYDAAYDHTRRYEVIDSPDTGALANDYATAPLGVDWDEDVSDLPESSQPAEPKRPESARQRNRRGGHRGRTAEEAASEEQAQAKRAAKKDSATAKKDSAADKKESAAAEKPAAQRKAAKKDDTKAAPKDKADKQDEAAAAQTDKAAKTEHKERKPRAKRTPKAAKPATENADTVAEGSMAVNDSPAAPAEADKPSTESNAAATELLTPAPEAAKPAAKNSIPVHEDAKPVTGSNGADADASAPATESAAPSTEAEAAQTGAPKASARRGRRRTASRSPQSKAAAAATAATEAPATTPVPATTAE